MFLMPHKESVERPCRQEGHLKCSTSSELHFSFESHFHKCALDLHLLFASLSTLKVHVNEGALFITV